jgi:glycosyltransferase involved in cell wall biosynthesis
MIPNRIVCLNQVSGPLFRELAEDLARDLCSVELVTAHLGQSTRAPNPSLQIVTAYGYDRRNIPRRIWSWMRYFLDAASHVLRAADRPILLIVSNPPFLPALGWIVSVLRGQKYCVLVYDIYPGVLIALGRISKHSPIAIAWRCFNRAIWARAEIVYTIGEYMAETIRRESGRGNNLRIEVVSNWVDVDYIKPIPKADNRFLRSLGWADGRMIVLYSGNIGNTHELTGLLQVAEQMRNRTDLAFLIIGGGSQWFALRDQVSQRNLENVKVLPLQPESLLRETLPAGDVAVVAMKNEVAGYMVPSKIYYYLAAGSAILALTPEKCEITEVVERDACGLRADPNSPNEIVIAIERFLNDPMFLAECQLRARTIAVQKYGRSNTACYIRTLKRHLAKTSAG